MLHCWLLNKSLKVKCFQRTRCLFHHRVSCNSEVSWIIIKTKPKENETAPSYGAAFLPALSFSIGGLCGPPGLQTDEGVPAAACNLLSPPPFLISDPAQLPLALWTAALRYCSLLHKHSCYDLPLSLLCSLHQGLFQPSNQSSPQAIWCKTSRLNWIEPAPLNVTLIVLNCLNSTLLSLFKQYPGLFHMRLLFLLSFAWVVENGVYFACPF